MWTVYVDSRNEEFVLGEGNRWCFIGEIIPVSLELPVVAKY